MPEDSGKKRYIKDFLQQVKSGTGFIDDIRIERVVRTPGSDGGGSTAKSLSGAPISTITQLLEDDLKHTFDEGYFTFRFVAALVGSGKTSLLTYLHELAKTKPSYQNHSVVVQFQLSDISIGQGGQAFNIRLYCHILADTFWGLLHNPNLPVAVQQAAENILSDFLDSSQVSQLKTTNRIMPFRVKFKNFISNNIDTLEEFFFHVIYEISVIDPQFSFVYLADELDALASFPEETEGTRLLFKELIRRAFQKFKSKIRLLIYLVGTSGNVGSFINGDAVIESLVGDLVINLSKGYSNEFGMIRAKIDERIRGAYQGYSNFPQAWQELSDIPLNSASTLRDFCREYTSSVLEIHEKYFKEEPEKKFEGNARQLVEAQCKQHWSNYLGKVAYKLSVATTTSVVAGHAFDCYFELLHNGIVVARAFGEAKNYELLTSHLETFVQWLEDANFKPYSCSGQPSDLAFMIAPSCPSLLERKLIFKNIVFVPSRKISSDTPPFPEKTDVDKPETAKKTCKQAVNINTADRDLLIKAFQGTGIKKSTVDRLIKSRSNRIYKSLDEMEKHGLISTETVKSKLQDKLNNNVIAFE